MVCMHTSMYLILLYNIKRSFRHCILIHACKYLFFCIITGIVCTCINLCTYCTCSQPVSAVAASHDNTGIWWQQISCNLAYRWWSTEFCNIKNYFLYTSTCITQVYQLKLVIAIRCIIIWSPRTLTKTSYTVHGYNASMWR